MDVRIVLGRWLAAATQRHAAKDTEAFAAPAGVAIHALAGAVAQGVLVFLLLLLAVAVLAVLVVLLGQRRRDCVVLRGVGCRVLRTAPNASADIATAGGYGFTLDGVVSKMTTALLASVPR